MARKYPMWCNCCEKKVYLPYAEAKCDGTDICPICGNADMDEYEDQDILSEDVIFDLVENGIITNE